MVLQRTEINVSYLDGNCEVEEDYISLIQYRNDIKFANCTYLENSSYTQEVVVGPSCDLAIGNIEALSTHYGWPLFLPGLR